MDEDQFLACFPRSGLGFTYRLQFCNTVGMIDSDYFTADNEGPFHVKFCNNGDKTVRINESDAYMQGIILLHFKTVDDTADGVRTGGLGFTSRS